MQRDTIITNANMHLCYKKRKEIFASVSTYDERKFRYIFKVYNYNYAMTIIIILMRFSSFFNETKKSYIQII